MNSLRSSIRRSVLFSLVLLLAAVSLPAQVDTGSADFTRYVSMGDSLTAGFTSGGLAQSAQQNSYPALIYRQATGSSAFEQPLVSDPGLPPLLKLISINPVLVVPKSGEGVPINLFLPRPYDNLGVPGARVHDVVATITDNGGAHDLILRGLACSPPSPIPCTQLQQALALSPTFVTLWIGNNDALAAATSGLVIEGVTLTPLSQFEADYNAIVNSLIGAGADLALATIPNVTSIPFVTAIPPFVVTSDGVVLGSLIGPDGPLGAGDYVLLTAGELLAQGIGVPVQLGGTGLPLPDQVVLSADEAATIQDRIVGYNNVIRTVASQVGAALVDANAIFDGIVRDGLHIGGVEYTAGYLTGGMFSYDGVHPTPFGYAFIAREFIKAINRTYSAKIPDIDLLPFIFGDPGRAPQVAVGTEVLLTARAWANIQWGLGLFRPNGPVPPAPGGGPGGNPAPPGAGVPPGPGPVPSPVAGPQPPGAPLGRPQIVERMLDGPRISDLVAIRLR